MYYNLEHNEYLKHNQIKNLTDNTNVLLFSNNWSTEVNKKTCMP